MNSDIYSHMTIRHISILLATGIFRLPMINADDKRKNTPQFVNGKTWNCYYKSEFTKIRHD